MENPEVAPEHAAAARLGDPRFVEGDQGINPRMSITEAERSWALTIKDAFKEDPELDNLNDFWYAQLAIVHKDDVEMAKSQALTMQHFRQEYDIRDDMEDVKSTMWDFIHLYDDDWVLGFSYNKDYQNYLWAVDIAAIDNQALQTDRAWRTNLAGHYYIRQALNPDFVSISQGIVIVHECGGFNFSGKFGGLGPAKRLAQEIIGNYPSLHHSLMWFNTGK